MASRAPLIAGRQPGRQYIADSFANRLIIATIIAAPFFGAALDQPSKSGRQYVPDVLLNPVALKAGPLVPFKPPLIDEPKAGRQYPPEILFNPVALAAGTSRPFSPPLIDEPKASRQYIPDVLFNPVSLKATGPSPFSPPLIDEPKASRQYIPDVLPNPVIALAAGPPKPVSSPLLDITPARRQYAPDVLLNPVLPGAGRSYPFALPLIDQPKAKRQYIPDVLFNSSVLGAPLNVSFSSSAGRFAIRNTATIGVATPSFYSSISGIRQTNATFRASISSFASSFGRLAFTNTFPYTYPSSYTPASLSAASFFRGYASPRTAPIVPAIGYQLTGTPAVWMNGPVTSTWQWNRSDTAISGATGLSYTPVSADIGNVLSLTETATNSGGYVSSTSAATSSVIANTAFLPANVAAPTITGTAQAGQVLTAHAGLWTNSPNYTYQWNRNASPIAGQTGLTYIPVTADIGNTISVTVTATNRSGPVSATSASTAAIIGQLPVNTALPTITGTPMVGNLLTGHAGTWLYSPTLTYQWARGGTPIGGATSINYTTVTADIGFTLTLVETGTSTSGGGSAMATSLPTAAVTSGGGADALNLGLNLTVGSIPLAS